LRPKMNNTKFYDSALGGVLAAEDGGWSMGDD